jgi:hypothetical protein
MKLNNTFYVQLLQLLESEGEVVANYDIDEAFSFEAIGNKLDEHPHEILKLSFLKNNEELGYWFIHKMDTGFFYDKQNEAKFIEFIEVIDKLNEQEAWKVEYFLRRSLIKTLENEFNNIGIIKGVSDEELAEGLWCQGWLGGDRVDFLAFNFINFRGLFDEELRQYFDRHNGALIYKKDELKRAWLLEYLEDYKEELEESAQEEE